MTLIFKDRSRWEKVGYGSWSSLPRKPLKDLWAARVRLHWYKITFAPPDGGSCLSTKVRNWLYKNLVDHAPIVFCVILWESKATSELRLRLLTDRITDSIDRESKLQARVDRLIATANQRPVCPFVRRREILCASYISYGWSPHSTEQMYKKECSRRECRF